MKPVHHRLAAAVAGVLVALLLAVPALAHAELVSSDPKDGAELETGPTTIELRFSEGFSASRSSFRLLGPDGEVETGSATKEGATRMSLDTPALAPGEYTIKWTAVAEDGHVERGTLSFAVVEAASAAPSVAAETSAPAPASAEPSVPASASPASASPASATPAGVTPSPAAVPADPADPAAASGSDVLLAIVAALVLVGGLGAFVLRRSRGA